jgi:hypothetical protein
MNPKLTATRFAPGYEILHLGYKVRTWVRNFIPWNETFHPSASARSQSLNCATRFFWPFVDILFGRFAVSASDGFSGLRSIVAL